MTYFTRYIEGKVRAAASTFPAIVLTGARQAGKSTLLRKLFPAHQYVTLDLPSDADQANRDPDSFFHRFHGDVVIDEVQYAPGLFRHLKVLIDQDRHRMGRYILTGSQKFTLMKEVSDSLAGRVAILNLENLSLSEAGLKTNSEWHKILHRGFFPELWRNQELSSNLFFSSYISTYLERDVRQIINVQSLRDFERFMRACAVRSGQLLNMSDLGRDVGIKSQTAKDWLSLLEATNQITLLEPYYEDIGKRIVKSPKLYLNDSGMLCFLLGLEESNLAATPLIGTIWETMVLAEFRKHQSYSSIAASLWFYRDAQGREVDFMEVSGGAFNLYEAKWSDGFSNKWLSDLEEVASALSASRSLTRGKLSIITRVDYPQEKNSVAIIHPVDQFQI
ncbi:MAG: hypothetical protein DCC75_09105 [Proteobacteria bacterium]|nr:MAG: hypothetical protein DCC75_09105 [Pseudomonadota bacterium]